MSEHPSHRRAAELAQQNIDETRDVGFQKKYPLEFAGHGGEQAVFYILDKDGERRGLVAKAEMKFIRRAIIRQALENWKSKPRMVTSEFRVEMALEKLGADPEGDLQEMEEYLVLEKQFYDQLKRFIPRGHMLRPKASIMTTPISRDTALEVLHEEGFDGLSVNPIIEAQTIVRFQQKIPEAAEPSRENPTEHSFGFGYIERTDINAQLYREMNQMFLDGTQLPNEFMLYAFLHRGIAMQLEKSKQDSELKEVLKELVSGLIRFTNETHEMVDIAGTGNISVFKNENGKWDYLLVDVYVGSMWSEGVEATNTLQRTRHVSQIGANRMANTLNYTRALNGMAQYLGLKERISLVDEKDPDTPLSDKSVDMLMSIRSAHSWPDRYIYGTDLDGGSGNEEQVKDTLDISKLMAVDSDEPETMILSDLQWR